MPAPSVSKTQRTATTEFGETSNVWEGIFSGPMAWPANVCLFRQGDDPKVVYLVRDGIVKLVHVDSDGNEAVIDVKGPTSLVGSAFVVRDAPYAFAATTVTACRVDICAAPVFRAALLNDPVRQQEVHRLHCAEIAHLTGRIATMGIKSSEQRLVQFLQQYVGDRQPSGRGRSPLTLPPLKHVDIAAFIGVTPEHLCRILKKLTKDGVIGRRNGRAALPHRGEESRLDANQRGG